jgi:hypothetical protein
LVAILLGLIGAFLAIFLQKVAVAIGGFVVGGYLAAVLCAPLIGSGSTSMESPAVWLCFLIGGILGAVLMMVFFNWALIILSSLQGAHLVIQALPALRHHSPILFLILAVIGIVIQASTYRRRTESA